MKLNDELRTIQARHDEDVQSVNNYFGSDKKSQQSKIEYRKQSVFDPNQSNDYGQAEKISLKPVFKQKRPQTAKSVGTH